MYLEELKSLSVDDKKKLIDFIEFMPSDLEKMVKININEDFMNPSIYKGAFRELHPYSTISKYINKKDISYTKIPIKSYYQVDYCSIITEIEELRIPDKIKSTLIRIFEMKSYDIDSIISVEMEITNLIENYKDSNFIKEVASFINKRILPIKYKAYDFYTYLCVKDYIQLKGSELYHFDKLNQYINILIESEDSFVNQQDLSILIYIYFKELGLTDVIEKYNLYNRFQFALLHNNKDEEYIRCVMNMVEEFVNNGYSVGSILPRLIHTEKLDSDNYEYDDIEIEPNENSIKSNGFIYFMKKPFINNDDLDMISNNIRRLSITEILNYLPEIVDKHHLIFDLSDNDLGHINNRDGLTVGTAYDSFSGNMKYIGSYNDDYYLFFKTRLNPKSVYGISLKIVDDDRKQRNILELKESKDYGYKYISTI